LFEGQGYTHVPPISVIGYNASLLPDNGREGRRFNRTTGLGDIVAPLFRLVSLAFLQCSCSEALATVHFYFFGKSWRKNEAVQMDSKENRAAEGSPPTLPLNNL